MKIKIENYVLLNKDNEIAVVIEKIKDNVNFDKSSATTANGALSINFGARSHIKQISIMLSPKHFEIISNSKILTLAVNVDDMIDSAYQYNLK